MITWLFVSLLLAPTAQEPRIGGAARLAAWEQHLEMATNSPFKELAWRRLGPKFAGGRIESIAAPRGDAKTLYVGVGAGGVWKSVSGGLTWTPMFERESTFAIGDIAVAESDANVVWVGTGECHLSSTSYAGTGVFKSTDAGETWTNMGLHESAHIGSVAIDPVDPDVVYVASMGRNGGGGERGIFKTSDGGRSFEPVLFQGDHVSFVDLVIDPTDRSRLFCSAWDRSRGHGSGVYRSTDHGVTWERLAGGLPEEDIDRVAIDVSRSKPGVVYALMADRSSPNLRKRRNASILFRSNDGGDTWTRTHEGYVPTYVGWDFCDLRVAPDDADHLYVGGLRLIQSTDGGKTFQGEGGFAMNRNRANVFRLHPHRGVGLHLDVHDIWIDPDQPDRVFLGNDGGLFASQDRGKTWLHLNNLPIAEFYRVHLDDEKPFRIWGGTQDNASFVGPSTTGFERGKADEWEQVFLDRWAGGDGFATFPDPNDPTITYYTQQNGDLKRSRLGQLRPDKSIKPSSGFGGKLRFAWDTPFFASSHGGETVLYCGAQQVFRSTNRGDSWEAWSPDFGLGALLAVTESPLDSKRLAAAGGRGRVHVTLDGGSMWDDVSRGLPKKRIRDVVLSTHDPKRIYVVLSGKSDHDCTSYVMVSNDYGQSWTSIAANLPDESVNTLAEDAATPDLLFVGTDLGVYVSVNADEEGSLTWNSLCHTLPTAPVVDIAVHARDGVLVAATHGLSIFSIKIDAIRNAASQ